MKTPVIASIGLLISSFSLGQTNDTTQLKEFTITEKRSAKQFDQSARVVTTIDKKEIEQAPVQTVDELLEFALNVDVKQRGPYNVQNDISLRGATFEQTLILLNGVKLSDPQTGHHNMNLPVRLEDISRIEILHGGASRIYGTSAFAGAINIITENAEENTVSGSVTGGEYGFYQAGVTATTAFENHSHRISASKSGSDGYIDNTDFERTNLFWQSEIDLNRLSLMANAGFMDKGFGAQNFYTSAFPRQFEKTRTYFSSLTAEYDFDQTHIRLRSYYRQHHDRFELYREGIDYYQRTGNGRFVMGNDTVPSWYNGHNYHQTAAYGSDLNVAHTWKLGETSVGVEYRKEEIYSNVLGHDLAEPKSVPREPSYAQFTQFDERENYSAYIEHNFKWKDLFVSMGTMYNINSQFDDEWFPGVDVSYKINKHFQPYASWSRSLRFPSFTNLYYEGGNSLGSLTLEPEKSVNYELGTKFVSSWFRGHVAAFRREGKNLIDWIRYNNSDTAYAANITEVNINGAELNGFFNIHKLLGEDFPVFSVRAGYTYLMADTTSRNFESSYVLDFLQHKADIALTSKEYSGFQLTANASYQDRVGGYRNAEEMRETPFDPVFLTNLRLRYRYKQISLYSEVSNLFDQDYVDIGNVQLPGRWMKIGFRFSVR